MPLFEYNIPSNIIVGSEILNRVGEVCSRLGEKIIVVLENSKYIIDSGIGDKIEKSLTGYTDSVIIFDELERNVNNYLKIENLKELVRVSRPDIVVGVGNYQVLSVAKFVASFFDKVLSQEDNINRKFTYYRRKRISYVEVPTTFGIIPGVSDTCFVYDPSENMKVTHTDVFSYADAIIFDTSIISSLPPIYVGIVAMDAMCQAFEAFISKASNPISDSFAYKTIETFYVNIKKFVNEPTNTTVLYNLCLAGAMGSMALALSKPGLATAISQSASLVMNIPPEEISAIIFPHVIDYNLTSVPGKLVQTAMALGEKIQDITVIEAAIKSAESIRKLLMDLNIPLRLSEVEYFDETKIDLVASITSKYSFLNYLPRPAGRNEINALLQAAL